MYLPSRMHISAPMSANIGWIGIHYLCSVNFIQPKSSIYLPQQNDSFENEQEYIKCPKGHYTYLHLACDPSIDCFYLGFREMENTEGHNFYEFCSSILTAHPPMFRCGNNHDFISYTLVCDHRADCLGLEDETFCFYEKCSLEVHFQCANKQVTFLVKRIFR